MPCSPGRERIRLDAATWPWEAVVCWASQILLACSVLQVALVCVYVLDFRRELSGPSGPPCRGTRIPFEEGPSQTTRLAQTLRHFLQSQIIANGRWIAPSERESLRSVPRLGGSPCFGLRRDSPLGNPNNDATMDDWADAHNPNTEDYLGEHNIGRDKSWGAGASASRAVARSPLACPGSD